jgi:hypothetical protein
MKTLVGSLVLLSSFALLASGCAGDQADDLTSTEDALTCGGFHHGSSSTHMHHNHRRHHHHHDGGSTGTGGSVGTGGSGMMGGSGMTTGTGGQPHLTGAGGSDTSGSAGSGMTGGTGGGTVDPRCAQMNGIISWWHADNDFDDSVGTNDGTSAGAAAFAPGIELEGFNLNGTQDSFVQVPNAPDLSPTSEITMDAWISPTVPGGRIVDKITAFFNDGYLLDLAGDQLRMLIGSDSMVSGPGTIPAGIFTHVAGVYGPSNGSFKMSLYINGALVAEHVTGQAAVPVNTNLLRIGADSSGGSLYSGVIDEPRVWNRALSADEIQTLFWQSSNCQP